MRCSANSTENPRRGERCRPVRKPSTTPSVTTSSPPSFETSMGSSRSGRPWGVRAEDGCMQRSIVSGSRFRGNPGRRTAAASGPKDMTGARGLGRACPRLYSGVSYADDPDWHTACCQAADTPGAPGGFMLATLGWMLLASLPLQSPTTIRNHARSAATPAPAAGRITLWTDQEDPYVRGQSARVFLNVDEPSYVAVLRVDTDGRIRVLFPRDPWGDTYVGEDRTFEVSGARGGRSFTVDDFPGMGYLFAVASTSPLDFDDLTRGDYWDYRRIDGGRVQGDPYVALTDLAERIARDGEYDYDVVPYYVERHYDYPRFVCYDCHAYASYDQWNPYRTACTRFRLVIRDDPRYYPYRSGNGRNEIGRARCRE